MSARRICFVTGSRADYGLLHHPMRAIAAEPGFALQVAVTGMHLSPQFGLTVGAIEADGFPIVGRVESLLASDTGSAVAKSMALGTAGFADLLARAEPDLLVLLGDRYEMLAAANAALVMGVPMAHLCGGDVTEGAYDDSIRHALTKMAHLHFVTNADAAKRVIQLGEAPDRVHDVGSSGLDFIRTFARLDRADLAQQLGVDATRPWLLVTFHPVTRDSRPSGEQLQALLDALEPLLATHSAIITQPNADNEGLTLSRQIEAWVAGKPHVHLFASLGQLRYLSVMAEAAAVIGNSSSGLYEAPSFAVPTVNIGTRQQGRSRAASVIDCPPERSAISAAIAQALTLDCTGVTNPYGDGHASERIVAVLKQVDDFRALLNKPFHDLEYDPMSDRVFLIAEVGVNHDGSLDKAKALIDVAADAGADAVKFQTFNADKLVSRDAPQAEYQKRNLGEPEGSQWELLKRLELSDDDHRRAAEHCAVRGIEFMSTPFDLDSAHFLVEGLKVQRLKVSSGDLTNAPFLYALARLGRPIILSSGMALLGDIELALGVIAHALTASSAPTRDAFRTAYASDEGQGALRERISLLHCTTEYPAPAQAINLRAMDTLADAFGLVTGYSDHSLGISVSLAAAARGAKIIEKHITLDSTAHGPDHAASLEPDAFHQLVAGVREIEQALGSPRKRSLPAEEGNRAVATKGLVAARPIAAGEMFSADNLAVKRPATGLPPVDYWELIGTPAPRDYDADAPITRV